MSYIYNKKRKKKKKYEIPLENYEKENNIKINLTLNYEGFSEKIKNKSKNKNNKNNNININLNIQKNNSSSTNNSSTDDDSKAKDYDNIIDNKFSKAYIKTKIVNSIKKGIKEYTQIPYNIQYNNLLQSYYHSKLLNQKLFSNIRPYYTNIEDKNNNNKNDIKYDSIHSKIFMNNYYNIYAEELYKNLNNKNIYNNEIEFFNKKITENRKNLEDIHKQINLIEKQNLLDMIISNQIDDLIHYIIKNNNIFNANNNNKINYEKKSENEKLEYPYYYMNHQEELEIKNILYLIEGLFLKENLIKDINIIPLLNRDGFVGIKKLINHPALIHFKVKEKDLITVFSEHRVNEVTETVETFDDIMIRNKDWKNIKKLKKDFNVDLIRNDLVKDMEILKNKKIEKLNEKKNVMILIQDELISEINNRILNNNVIQNSYYNYINNIYNYQNNYFNYNIYNNDYNNQNQNQKFGINYYY